MSADHVSTLPTTPGVATRPGAAWVYHPPCFRYCWAAGCFGIEVREGWLVEQRERERRREKKPSCLGAYGLADPVFFSLGQAKIISSSPNHGSVLFDGGFQKGGTWVLTEKETERTPKTTMFCA